MPPEPRKRTPRTEFERALVDELESLTRRYALVRGLDVHEVFLEDTHDCVYGVHRKFTDTDGAATADEVALG